MNPEEEMRQHWQALAEQLGLEVGSEPPASASPRPKPATEAPARSQKSSGEEKSAPLSRGEIPAASGGETFASRGRRRQESPAEKATMEPGPAFEPGPVEEQPETGREARGRRPSRAQAAEDEAPGPGAGPPNRREAERPAEVGSRGHHEAEVGEPEGEETPPEKSRRRGRGRGHGRGRRKEAGVAETSAEPGPTEAEAAPSEIPPPPSEDDDEPDNLSDWNVPSWTELIASLYRPER